MMDVCVGGKCTWVVFFCLLLTISECCECSWLHTVCANEKSYSFSYIFSHMLLRAHEDTYFQASVAQCQSLHFTPRVDRPTTLAVSADGHIQHNEALRIFRLMHKLFFLLTLFITCKGNRIHRLYSLIWYVTVVSRLTYFWAVSWRHVPPCTATLYRSD